MQREDKLRKLGRRVEGEKVQNTENQSELSRGGGGFDVRREGTA